MEFSLITTMFTQTAGPLWQRDPTPAEHGGPTAEFMALINRLKQFHQHGQRQIFSQHSI